MSLVGKKAVIFGGCGGIGLVICQRLLQEGVQKLFILDVAPLSETSRNLLNKSNENGEVVFKHCDISNNIEVQKTLQDDIVGAFGTFDILVIASGIAAADVADKVIGVNLTGVINASLFTLGLMSKAKGGNGGVILNVASIAGLVPIPFLPIYCASKFGVVGFTRSLGVPQVFDETGVKFITICPGATETGLFRECHKLITTQAEVNALQQLSQDYINRLVVQSPDVVGACVVRAINEGENGSAWICNEGNIVPFEFPAYPFL